MGASAELYEFIVRVVEDKLREVRVAREEYEALRKAVEKLVEAHAKAEERLARLEAATEKLVAAHTRAEERISRLEAAVQGLEAAVAKLAEAQARTEERISRLEEAVAKLAEAQARTEERVSRLEEAVAKLAEAQARTEERLLRLETVVEKLAAAVDALRVEVGRLSETVGFGLEDIARAVLPGWLFKRLGVEVEELRREFFVVDGEEVEVNLYGEGTLKGEKVVVVGEAKSRVYGSDVERFYHKVYAPLSGLTAAKTVGVLIGYLVHPSAKKRAEELGVHVVAAYEASR